MPANIMAIHHHSAGFTKPMYSVVLRIRGRSDKGESQFDACEHDMLSAVAVIITVEWSQL